eukprot:497409-Pleurochrysis_carterae.AAC.1
MSWLAIAVTDGKGVGLTRERHRQADIVAQLVAERIDGEFIIANGQDVAVVADQVCLRSRRLLHLRELLGGTSCSPAGGRIRRLGLSVRERMQGRKLGRRGHGGERVI